MPFFKNLRLVLLCLMGPVFGLVFATSAYAEDAESAEDKIARAMLAAPESISGDAMVNNDDASCNGSSGRRIS